MSVPKQKIRYRGYLMHVSHYDPSWCMRKPLDSETPFDSAIGCEVVAAMAEAGMNLLVLDVSDGARYKSHPEMARHYTVPMKAVKSVCDAAHKAGIDVVPKLNFSKSIRNQHDYWLLPHTYPYHCTGGMEDYYRVAKDTIAELVAVCRPERFFHIGMDEDHCRSVPQYVDTIMKLRAMVKQHKLRTIIWNDSCHDDIKSSAHVHACKSMAAEKLLPKDIIHVLWDYRNAHANAARRLTAEKFEFWAAPGRTVELVQKWKQAVLQAGGTGLLLTNWMKCAKENQAAILNLIRELGPACR